MAKKKSPRVLSPMPIHVEEDEDMRPIAVTVEGKTLAVDTINEREDEEVWWETPPVAKMNYQVTLEDGRNVSIVRNMMQGRWYAAENTHPFESPGGL